MPIRKIGRPLTTGFAYNTPFSLFTLYKEIPSEDYNWEGGKAMLLPEVPQEIYGEEVLTNEGGDPMPYVSYELKPGDTLWRIALNRYGNARFWFNIWRINLLKHPLAFIAGDIIKLPQEGLIN